MCRKEEMVNPAGGSNGQRRCGTEQISSSGGKRPTLLQDSFTQITLSLLEEKKH